MTFLIPVRDQWCMDEKSSDTPPRRNDIGPYLSAVDVAWMINRTLHHPQIMVLIVLVRGQSGVDDQPKKTLPAQ